MLIRCFLMFLALAWHASAQESPPLRPIADVLRLDAAALQRGESVRIRAVTTYVREGIDRDLIVQDATGGIYVAGSRLAGAEHLEPGREIEVEGVTVFGNFAPRIVARVIRPLGMVALPSPEVVSFDDLRSGRCDCRRVEIAAVVRSVSIEDRSQPPQAVFLVATPAGSFNVWCLEADETMAHALVDASVRVQGVAFAWDTSRRQFRGFYVLANKLSDFRITRPPSGDPFAAPLSTPESLLRFHPDGLAANRVRLRGVVTWVGSGDSLVLQSGDLGLRIRTEARDLPPILTEIEAAGFPGLTGNVAELQDAVLRPLGRGAPVVPPEFRARQLLSQEDTPDVDLRLVKVVGLLRTVKRRSADWELLLEDDGVSFTAQLPASEAPVDLKPGSLLELTGVCDLRPNLDRVAVLMAMDGFSLLLRGPADIRVIRGGPWLDRWRLLMLVVASVVALLAALVWAFSLRRRVQRRTAQLAREVRFRQDASVEARAILAERERLAAELHDSLQQRLTGAALQLSAVELASEEQDVERVRRHVASAQSLLKRSRDDLRDSVWNLRHDPGETTDLAEELRELAAGMTAGGGPLIEVRGSAPPLPEPMAHHLIRIAQEAMTNAVNHGNPRHISIDLQCTDREVVLAIADDGCGFAPGGSTGTGVDHFGLGSMRKRAGLLGGTLAIDGGPGRGTTLTLTAPRSMPS
jgi:signal transduction histidine kinase